MNADPIHLPVTSLPGELGLTAIFGRGSSYGSPFRRLDQLTPDDEITVCTATSVHTDAVSEAREEA